MSQRCGLVAVIGAPNAGKSTLVNALVGQKVAIVSAKAQTTRARLMGIALAETEVYRSQLLLSDTPGVFAMRSPLPSRQPCRVSASRAAHAGPTSAPCRHLRREY